MSKSKFSTEQRVRYRPAPSATETLGGVVVRKARGKLPCCMVLLDGREEESLAYDHQLELEPSA